MKFTDGCSNQLKQLSLCLLQAEAVIIGAGAGMSAAAGFTYSGERFEHHFQDFIRKYGFTDMYSAGFYPYETLEEYWAYWSRHISVNRYGQPPGKPYETLLELVKGKDYFVLTTNVDHRFQVAGFDKGWHDAADRYQEFLQRHRGLHVLYLELGVGANTPGIIKYPFWQMTFQNENAVYACINMQKPYVPAEIKDRSICINGDIGSTLEELKAKSVAAS